MKKTHVIQKIVNAESVFNILFDDYNKLLNEYKQQTSFSEKIKQAVVIKRVDVTIYNILDVTTALIKYAVLKKTLDIDLAKHYTQLFKSKFNTYVSIRNSVFGMRKNKILEKRKERQRAAGAKRKNDNLQSVPVPSSVQESAATPEAVL